jgi:hypothetical protein
MLKEQARTFEGLTRVADISLIAVSFSASAIICERLEGVKETVDWMFGRSGSQVSVSSEQYALLLVSSLIGWLLVTKWRDTYISAREKRFRSTLFHNLVTQFLWVLYSAAVLFFLSWRLSAGSSWPSSSL